MPCTPHFIGNNLALDFLNSVYGVGEDRCDCLADDAAALAWLKAAGLLAPGYAMPVAGLAMLARTLRDAGARLIDAGAATLPRDIETVNRILDAGQPRQRLVREEDGRYALASARRDDSLSGLLEPVASALARLLAEGELAQVHRCEAHDCTLRFLDITKSRRRRWCSMALCGNRMKVAAFRARKDAAADGHRV